MTDEVHHLLIAEDEPEVSARLAAYVASLGMTSRVAATLVEIDAAIAEEHFCCVLLDKQLPVSLGLPPFTSTGDTGQKRIRALDPRRTAADHHILPILVISGAAAGLSPSGQAAFMSKNFREGASGYIPKPFDAETVTGEILAALERAGRADHARCADLRCRAAGGEAGQIVTLSIDGTRLGRRSAILVNGQPCGLQDSWFVPFLALAAERARGSMGCISPSDLGIERTMTIPSRIREAVAAAVPEGFSIVQRGKTGYRLHPLVRVEAIDWAALERHPDPAAVLVVDREKRRRKA